MTDIDAARNLGAHPGQPLHDTIDLPGWDHRSIWGYDDGVPSFFYVQLWLSGVDPLYPWPACIALAIVERPETTRWP